MNFYFVIWLVWQKEVLRKFNVLLQRALRTVSWMNPKVDAWENGRSQKKLRLQRKPAQWVLCLN